MSTLNAGPSDTGASNTGASPELDELKTREDAASWDAADPLAWARQEFHLPEGALYFDGNSLGPLPKASRRRSMDVVDQQWGEDLITSWNRHDWIGLPRKIGGRIAPLIGAEPDQVVVCDSVSVNLFKVLAAALRLRPGRRTLLCQEDHFPTDLYIAQGLAGLLSKDGDAEIKIRYAQVDEMDAILTSDPDRSEIAAVCLGHVDFRSGRLFPMAELTRAMHDAGALAVWDLSHSAGALPVKLDDCQVDFAVGCGYKFLNGGPGAPAFLYAARRHHEGCANPLPGWLGHRRPFAFERDYEPAEGIDRFVCGTPPILAMSSLDAALELWEKVDLEDLRLKSRLLGDLFLKRASRFTDEFGLQVACPEDSSVRGSQVCLRHPDGYAVIQALIERGMTGDFRAPDILRFGLTPLYQSYVDVWDAVDALEDVVRSGIYREQRFHRRAKVT